MSKSRSKQQVISTKAKYWSTCAQFDCPVQHPAFTDVHTDHDIRAPHGCGATSPVRAQPPTLRDQFQWPRPQSLGKGPGRYHVALTILKSRDLGPKVEAMQDEAGRSRRIHQESLLTHLLKREENLYKMQSEEKNVASLSDSPTRHGYNQTLKTSTALPSLC